MGRIALADVSTQLIGLPPEMQIALVEHTNPGSVDWTKPNEIREFYSRVKSFVEKGSVDGKPLTPQMQEAMMAAAITIVVSQINSDPDQKLKAMKAFAEVVQQQKSGEKPLVDFANAVLVKAAESERPEAKKAAKAEAAAKAKQTSNIENIIYRMYGRVKAMEWAVFDKKKDPWEQFSLLKVNTRRLIQLLPTKDLGINLPEVLKQVANAKTPEQLANILESILKNPNLKLSAPAKKYLWEMVSALKDIDHEMKRQEAAAKKPADSKRPAQQAKAGAQAVLDSRINDYFRRSADADQRPQKGQGKHVVDVNTKDILVAAGQAGNGSKGNGNGSGSGQSGANGRQPQPQQTQPQLADAGKINGGRQSQTQFASNAGKAVADTEALDQKNRNGHSV